MGCKIWSCNTTPLFLEFWRSDHNTNVDIFVKLVWIYYIGMDSKKVDVMVAVIYVKPTIINGFAAREAMLGTHFICLQMRKETFLDL